MTPWDPNYIGVDFERVTRGYLSTPANRLAMIFAGLPRAASVRERAIEAALAWGVSNPGQWDAGRRPLRLTKPPRHALEAQDGWR